jgi:transposase-like protein
LRCGACGGSITTLHRREGSYYECGHSRADHINTPGCRSVKTVVVDELVARRVLDAMAPEEIALALAAADQVSDRRARSTRAVELRVERARYDAARAERAFHACEPENRLVARSLETRWEQKLKELAEAEAELAEERAPAPEPSREQIERLARDLPALWAAESTCEKDHKRLLRALIADITITSQPEGRELRVGIRWRSGASEEHTVQRPKTRQEVIRTPSEAIKLTRRLAPDHPNTQIAEQLNAAGLRTGTGGPFAAGHVQWIRWRHKIPYPATLANDGERTVSQIANELGVSDATIYDWITTGKLTAAADRRTGSTSHTVPTSSRSAATWSRTPFTYPPKPKSGLQEVQFDATVPTVADRVAQTAPAMFLEPLVEPRFHQDSYGYRPKKSAHDAVGVCRQRCWKYDWVIDLDVQKFFDTVPWELVVRAVEAVTDCRWVLLSVRRWLETPAAAPGWHACAARQGNPARIGNFAGPGEPVHALRV